MMDFGNIIKAPCANTAPPPNPQCNDPAFALQNPSTCPTNPTLLLKPGSSIVCLLGSMQYRAFVESNGQETDVTSQTVFSVSDPTIVVIGASSGNATGISGGDATITATYQGMTATADLTVIASANCCRDETVAYMVMIDDSLSMSQAYGDQYSTKLDFAKFAAQQFINGIDATKDVIGVMSFDGVNQTVIDTPSNNLSKVASDAAAITQTQNTTSYFVALQAAVAALQATGADKLVIVLITDGQDESQSYIPNNPISLAQSFQQNNGYIIGLGIRCSGAGFNLMNSLCTGGFFVNSYPGIETDAVNLMMGIKGYFCGSSCIPAGDEFVATGQLNYTNWTNWSGIADLLGNDFIDLLPGNGLYVDLSSPSSPYQSTLISKNAYAVNANDTYSLSLFLAGNQRVNIPSNVTVTVQGASVIYVNQTLSINDYTQGFQKYSFSFTPQANDNVTITITGQGSNSVAIAGPLLDSVSLDDTSTLTNIFSDNFDTENLQYIPPRCGQGTTPVYTGYNGSASVSLIPAMTSNTAPSGVASCSALNSAQASAGVQANAFVAFDNTGGWFVGFLGQGASEAWVQYQFPTAQRVTSYRLFGIGPNIGQTGDSDNPASWKLSGSNDGINFTDLDTQTNFPFNVAPTTVTNELSTGDVGAPPPDNEASSYIYNTFTIASPGSYAYYRLHLYKNTISSNSVTVAELQLFGSLPGYGFSYGYNCYVTGCLDSNPVPAQAQDPNPLPDIEAGETPPQVYTSTKQACVTCPSGFANVSTTDLIPAMTDDTDPSGTASVDSSFNGVPAFLLFDDASDTYWASGVGGQFPHFAQYQFPQPTIVTDYAITAPNLTDSNASPYNVQTPPISALAPGGNINECVPSDWQIQGSNDGSTWTTLDTQTGIYWAGGQRQLFAVNNATAYTYYRVLFTANNYPNANAGQIAIQEIEMFGATDGQACASATATSSVSQADADSKAMAAATTKAQAMLNCQQEFTSTQSYTAHCPIGSLGLGGPVTKSATAVSFLSQAAADALALSLAQAAAQAALNCTGSNNQQAIAWNNGAQQITPATPYPSVKFVTGLTGHITKVTVTVKNFTANNPFAVEMVLQSPSGKMITLMNEAGGPNNANAASNLTFTFDDAAGSALPQNAALASGTYKPSIYGLVPALTSPAAAPPYLSTLASLIGDDPNGAWALWVQDVFALDSGNIAGVPSFDLTITSA